MLAQLRVPFTDPASAPVDLLPVVARAMDRTGPDLTPVRRGDAPARPDPARQLGFAPTLPLPALSVQDRSATPPPGRPAAPPSARSPDPGAAQAAPAPAQDISPATLTGASGEQSALAHLPRRTRWRRTVAIAGGAGAVFLTVGVCVAVYRSVAPGATGVVYEERRPGEAAEDGLRDPGGAARPTPQTQPTAAPDAGAGEAPDSGAQEPATASPGGATVRVTLDLRPAGARVFLDDQLYPDNPIRLVASDAPRQLRVEADGYWTWSLRRRFAQDARITVRLRRLPARATPPGKARRPAKSGTAAPGKGKVPAAGPAGERKPEPRDEKKEPKNWIYDDL